MNTRIALVGVVVAGVFALTACSSADPSDGDVQVQVKTGASTTYCSTCKTQPTYSKCEPIAVDSYGSFGKEAFLGNARLARLVKNRTTGAYEVPCVYMEKPSRTTCQVNASSAPWFRGKDGNIYMKTGYRIDQSGNAGGDYVISAVVSTDYSVPCVDPLARDSAGVSATTELAAACVVETINVATNATGLLLDNYATREVCTTSYPHPDGAELVNKTSPYCYFGRGAGVNDINGTERDDYGVYYPDENHCHVGWVSGVEVPVAKRPATKSYPAPGIVNPYSAILWRPVADKITIAN